MQGLGNVGFHTAKFCREQGAVIIAFAEREGAIFNPKGLNEEDVVEHRRRTGSILGFPGATDLANSADALELECDVLVPAALENQLTAENAPRIKAKIVLEAANGPTTPDADAVFRQKGMLVIPDVYANAGGVTVSYFEWLKNLSHVRMGRLDRRRQAATEMRLLHAIELATGKKFTDTERLSLVRVTDELAIVNSGLEDTMIVRLSGHPRRAAPAARSGRSAHRRLRHRHQQSRDRVRRARHLPVTTKARRITKDTKKNQEIES